MAIAKSHEAVRHTAKYILHTPSRSRLDHGHAFVYTQQGPEFVLVWLDYVGIPPRFSICMVLVCNWDDPSSADVDHMDFLNVFSFTFTALFIPRDGWAILTSTILSVLHHTIRHAGTQEYALSFAYGSGACLASRRMVDG
jgi:hypothetical protein